MPRFPQGAGAFHISAGQSPSRPSPFLKERDPSILFLPQTLNLPSPRPNRSQRPTPFLQTSSFAGGAYLFTADRSNAQSSSSCSPRTKPPGLSSLHTLPIFGAWQALRVSRVSSRRTVCLPADTPCRSAFLKRSHNRHPSRRKLGTVRTSIPPIRPLCSPQRAIQGPPSFCRSRIG